ncbi:UNVERIFIED_CONTAM: Peptidyl-prolyl cis-trans isomerase CYP95 [Sesamum radiatum]|uniref:Peptidyl-prolyl cis-trans isomerase CYP95 n=1 Tax=Sesamum radiatum TaxID=300843 RepID=A0AAW2KZX3_SESRA
MEKIKRRKQLVFLDVSIDGDPVERMIFELFTDVAPKTAENFRALCTGEKGVSAKTGKPLHYKGTFFHRIKKGYLAQGGDFLRQDGNYGESIYDGKFPAAVRIFYLKDLLFLVSCSGGCVYTVVWYSFKKYESPKLKHDGPGLLSMAIADRDERGSLFSVTFKADRRLDRKCVVFGELVDGHEVLKKIENAGDEEGKPSVTVKIINSGQLHDGEAVDVSEREEGEFPTENGDHQSNGVGLGIGSDHRADRQPDLVEDRRSKSRSQSLSPRRAMSKSMSTSPRRSTRRTPGVGSKHSRSRSPSVSRSPSRSLTEAGVTVLLEVEAAGVQ